MEKKVLQNKLQWKPKTWFKKKTKGYPFPSPSFVPEKKNQSIFIRTLHGSTKNYQIGRKGLQIKIISSFLSKKMGVSTLSKKKKRCKVKWATITTQEFHRHVYGS